MKFTREANSAVMIRNVDADAIHIGEQRYTRPLALTPEAVLDDWQTVPFADLESRHLEALLDGDPELLLLGTGQDSRFASREIMFALARRGVGLEVMTTAAAARTFNVLVSEGRRVVALLYI